MDQSSRGSRPATLADRDPELLELLEGHALPPDDGLTIAAYLPPSIPSEVTDRLFDQIAELVHATTHETHLVALPGDPLQLWTEPAP